MPSSNHEFSVTVRTDVEPHEVDKLVGPVYADVFFYLCNRLAFLRDSRMDPEAAQLTEQAIARNTRARGGIRLDEQTVNKALIALRDAGLISFLHLGKNEPW